MRNFLKIAIFASLASFSLVSCGKVPAGNVGVKIYLLGSDKGIDSEELTPGRYYIGWNEELYLFPTFTQNYVWTADNREGSEQDESVSFQSREGMNINADIGVSYSIDPSRATDIFQKYRRGVGELTDTAIRNAVQNAFVGVASSKPIESVYGEGKVEMLQEVQKIVTDQFAPLGIKIENIYYVGNLRFDEVVTASINAKIAATQKAQQRQNEVQQSRAEADKKIEEARGEAMSILAVAKAQAEANEIISHSLTSELVQYKQIEKWNGELPRITSNGSGFMFNNTEELIKSTASPLNLGDDSEQ